MTEIKKSCHFFAVKYVLYIVSKSYRADDVRIEVNPMYQDATSN